MIKQSIYMQEALNEAKKSALQGEVPVGAVLVKDGNIIYKSHNLTITNKDPTAHAEILVIRAACNLLKTERLVGCDLYVTLEPCIMCSGALLHARISRLYFGAYDIKYGSVDSNIHVLHKNKQHNIEVYGGIMEKDCSKILKSFFESKRLED